MQVGLQTEPVFLGEIAESERLQAAFRGPHRKQSDRLGAHRARSHVEDHFDSNLLIQGILQLEDSARGGELVQSGTHLLAVFQPNYGQDGATEFDARRTFAGPRCSRSSHVFHHYDIEHPDRADYESMPESWPSGPAETRDRYQIGPSLSILNRSLE